MSFVHGWKICLIEASDDFNPTILSIFNNYNFVIGKLANLFSLKCFQNKVSFGVLDPRKRFNAKVISYQVAIFANLCAAVQTYLTHSCTAAVGLCLKENFLN